MKTTPLHPPVQRVSVQFVDSGLTHAMRAGLVRYCRASIGMMFGIDQSLIELTGKAKLPMGVPFNISCCISKSETNSVAQVLAGRCFIPALQQFEKLSKSAQERVSQWTPGCSMDTDAAMLQSLARGDFISLTAEQTEWLEHMAWFMNVNMEQPWEAQELAYVIQERSIAFDLVPDYPGQFEPVPEMMTNTHDEY